MKLYYNPMTRALKTLWLLEEMELEYELVLRDLDRSGDFHSQNVPGGKFPALEDGEVVMSESGAILEYLLERYPNDLCPDRTSSEWPTFLMWVHYADSTAFSVFEMLLWHTSVFEDSMRAPVVVETETPWAHSMLTHIDQALADQKYILGDKFSGADIHLGFACIVAKMADLTRGYKNVNRWLNALEERPALIRARSVGA